MAVDPFTCNHLLKPTHIEQHEVDNKHKKVIKKIYCAKCIWCGVMITEAHVIYRLNQHDWMRREIERVGEALFTNGEGKYLGTEEDLQAIGQFVEGCVDTLDELREENERLEEVIAELTQTKKEGLL